MPGTEALPPVIVLFDGVCNFCNASAVWIIRRDRRALIRLAALQSPAGQAALRSANATQPLPDSLILIDSHGVHVKSDAALGIARHLGFPWSWACILKILPKSLRNAVYDYVARHRYAWFGKQSQCAVPTPEMRERFLSDRP